MKRVLLILLMVLPVLADEPVVRVQSIQPVDGKSPTQLLQKRPDDSKSYPVLVNATGYVQDHFRTDKNTLAALEFLIGGRVGVNQGTDVEIVNERSVAGGQLEVKRIVLKTGSMWVKADAKTLKQPIEIQTNGGTLGIKGTEFTVAVEEDGTVEVNCFESTSTQGGVEVRDAAGQLVGTARPGDQYRLNRQRKPAFRRFQNIAQHREQILNGPRFRTLRRNQFFAQRFLGGLGAMPPAEMARAFYQAQTHRKLERNPFARNRRNNTSLPGKRRNRAAAFTSNTFPSRLAPDSTDPGQRPGGPHPKFSWIGVPRADGYLVTISRDEVGDENLFTRRVKTTKTSYPPSMRPLKPGLYYWRVTPLDAKDEPMLEASQTTFEVAPR